MPMSGDMLPDISLETSHMQHTQLLFDRCSPTLDFQTVE